MAVCALLFVPFLTCAALTGYLVHNLGFAQIREAADAGVRAGTAVALVDTEHLRKAARELETAALPHLHLPPSLITEWYGGKAMERERLRDTLRFVTRTLKPGGEWCTTKVHDLLMETAAVETALGYIVRQKNGPALSVWQILGFNFREIPEYFGKRDPDLLARAMQFYNPDRSEEWNRVHNIPWTAAMSLLFYEKASDGKFLTRLDTLDERGKLWKQLYNTRLGKGTVKGYKQRAREYVHVETS